MDTSERITFPNVPVAEWTALRPFTAPGLFAYRYIQSFNLLELPDFGDGDMNREQRKDALKQYINCMRPLTAIVIFLNVVALEDFIRDFGMRLSYIENLEEYFPNISKLRMIPQIPNPDKPSKQLDKDPAPLMDFGKLNDLYFSCLGVNPINKTDFPRLYDLTIIRHCIAHNGSIIREVDLARFQYYKVEANQIINPPADFVKETCNFLYSTGKYFENSLRDTLFQKIIQNLKSDWKDSKPKIITDLFHLFNFFGKIPSSNKSVTKDLEEVQSKNEDVYKEVVDLCIKDLGKIPVHKMPCP